MAHIKKVARATKDGKKRHAWKVRYRDPDRIERARTFDKRADAEGSPPPLKPTSSVGIASIRVPAKSHSKIGQRSGLPV